MVTYAVRWINLQKIVLSERSQIQKATYSIIPQILNIQETKIQKEDQWLLGAGLRTEIVNDTGRVSGMT